MSERPTCPYCGAKAVLVTAATIYGPHKGQGLIWACGEYPACDSFVGCHRGTARPLGTLADRELRLARIEAHQAFDPLWQSGPFERDRAYLWLSRKLGIDPRDCHIGKMGVADCRRVVRVCNSYRAEYA